MDDESDFSEGVTYEPCPLCGDMVEQGFECRYVKKNRSLSMTKDNNNGKGQGQQEAQEEANNCGAAALSGEEASSASTQAKDALDFSFEIPPALRDILEFQRRLAEDFRCEMAEYVARINRAMAESEQKTFRHQLHHPPYSIFMK